MAISAQDLENGRRDVYRSQGEKGFLLYYTFAQNRSPEDIVGLCPTAGRSEAAAAWPSKAWPQELHGRASLIDHSELDHAGSFTHSLGHPVDRSLQDQDRIKYKGVGRRRQIRVRRNPRHKDKEHLEKGEAMDGASDGKKNWMWRRSQLLLLLVVCYKWFMIKSKFEGRQ